MSAKKFVGARVIIYGRKCDQMNLFIALGEKAPLAPILLIANVLAAAVIKYFPKIFAKMTNLPFNVGGAAASFIFRAPI